MSHPVWDEWIEIRIRTPGKQTVLRLIPFGMSGLKFRSGSVRVKFLGSHPVWDEWIEIAPFAGGRKDSLVSSRLG